MDVLVFVLRTMNSEDDRTKTRKLCGRRGKTLFCEMTMNIPHIYTNTLGVVINFELNKTQI